MDIGGNSLPLSINPNHFPAKLWRLVNNPANEAICWDSEGSLIIIDQLLFEKQILSPGAKDSDSTDAFKTTNFSSFVRQLNLYGFKKADLAFQDGGQASGDNKWFHHFYNPNFKRNHPELLGSLMRLTVDNKAKMKTGMQLTRRTPTRFQQLGVKAEGKARRGSSSPFSPTRETSPHPYYLNKAQAMAVHNGTPIPPQYLMRGNGAALSPTIFASNKGIPASLCHRYAEAASRSTPVLIQPGLQVHGSPNFPTFNPPHSPYKPSFYSAVCRCFQLNSLASPLTDSGLKTGSFSPHTYYQPRYPVSMSHGDHNQEPQKDEKCDISMDTIFQIADEVMETPPNNSLVRVVPLEKPSHVIVSTSSASTISPVRTVQDNPLCDGPIIMSISGNAYVDKEQEELVLSVPEQMPEDAIFESPLCPGKVSGDDAKDTEVIDVGVNDSLVVTSQAYKSSCTGSTPNL